jgi:uncharacterized RDD family membrane protein YckC
MEKLGTMTDVYATPTADLATSQSVAHSGFWIRVVAAIVDSLWMALLLVPLVWWVYGPAYFVSDSFVQGTADFFISYVLPAVLVVGFWVLKGATPGKLLVGARIVDANTLGPAGTGRLIVRYLGYYLSGVALCLGFLWVAFDRQKRGWHDLIAGTVVIKSR